MCLIAVVGALAFSLIVPRRGATQETRDVSVLLDGPAREPERAAA